MSENNTDVILIAGLAFGAYYLLKNSKQVTSDIVSGVGEGAGSAIGDIGGGIGTGIGTGVDNALSGIGKGIKDFFINVLPTIPTQTNVQSPSGYEYANKIVASSTIGNTPLPSLASQVQTAINKVAGVPSLQTSSNNMPTQKTTAVLVYNPAKDLMNNLSKPTMPTQSSASTVIKNVITGSNPTAKLPNLATQIQTNMLRLSGAKI